MPTASLASVRTRVPHLRESLTIARVGMAAILFAILPLNAQQPLTLSTNQTITATVAPTTTLLHLGLQRVVLKRDNTVARSISPPVLKLVAELPGKTILLTDTYPSRPFGLSRCQAGEEQFLRVIALLPRPAETFHLKLASCRDNIELADDGLRWSPETQTITVHWLTPPAPKSSIVILRIASNGRVVASP